MSSRRVQGRLQKLSPQHKAKRALKRQRKKTWAVRIWARRHVKGKA